MLLETKCSNRFQGIEVDGQAVDPSNYEAKAGSVVLTLRESYIRSLGTGRHSIKAKFRGGESASTSFSVTRAGAGSSVSSRPGAGAGAASRPGMARVGAVHRNVVKTGDNSNVIYICSSSRSCRCSSCRSCFLQKKESVAYYEIY